MVSTLAAANAAGTANAAEIAGAVPDPELPMLTLADLGVLAGVEQTGEGEAGEAVTVWLTPTYSGCPAVAEMAADVDRRLRAAGFAEVRVRLRLDPPWSTDLITAAGRDKLAAAGIAPPSAGLLQLGRTRLIVDCPQCGSADTEELSRFGSTACKALWRCRACREPFERMKEI
ncbi:phenylacetate-CoA oxygenase subunit PaaJ [Kitasatospora sp. NBC_01287]|uniref:1,2-phenylacetyl-CoA epoxidase subunit PaaD n=1 Tax=Kitasatospora sp. NBC_01287 TaxID=2903573 RepID=UPI002251D0BF|nr:1,2-phenylacetyl-CoA epoxidase subunit PaaD [Kitasatospora sp. NBC_01287]MCX4745426.1 phenylacetate-CoA oxygenase subunit PaaJ [Kitasatospora sp. NBC_01287]